MACSLHSCHLKVVLAHTCRSSSARLEDVTLTGNQRNEGAATLCHDPERRHWPFALAD